MALRAGRVVSACREALAGLVGGAPERIIFALNCTDALNIAIRGSLRQGDHVLVTHDAHNAVMQLLAGLERRGRVSLSVLTAGSDGLIAPEAIDQAVQPQTSLCILTHASNVTGTIQPVQTLIAAAHRHGLPVLLDAAQTAGTLELKNIGADMIAMPEITVYGDGQAPHVGVLSFNVRDRECAEIADLLDQKGFCLRGGLHCAPCMHHWLGTQGMVRASAGL